MLLSWCFGAVSGMYGKRWAGRRKELSMLSRIGAAVTGIVLFVYGMIAAFTPLPGGAPLVIIGVLLVAVAAPATRPLLRAMRARWAWFDGLVRVFAKIGPRSVIAVAEETAPDRVREPEAGETDPVRDGSAKGRGSTGPATGVTQEDKGASDHTKTGMKDKGQR